MLDAIRLDAHAPRLFDMAASRTRQAAQLFADMNEETMTDFQRDHAEWEYMRSDRLAEIVTDLTQRDLEAAEFSHELDTAMSEWEANTPEPVPDLLPPVHTVEVRRGIHLPTGGVIMEATGVWHVCPMFAESVRFLTTERWELHD